MGENSPYDKFGSSMILIEVSKDNKIESVTLRWNNLSGNNLNLTEYDLKEMLGDSFQNYLKRSYS